LRDEELSDRAAQQGVPPARRILLVDDSPLSRRVVRGGVEQLGFTVEEAGDGVEALAALEQGQYAAVLMVCQMPRMDGFEATVALRRRETAGHRTPVIALTATLTPADLERCIESGMDDYVAKPVRLDELEETLARWVRVPTAESAPRTPLAEAGAASPIDRETFQGLVELLGTGERGALSEAVGLFLEEGAQRLNRLRAAVRTNDSRDLERAAHALKGSAGTFGALEVRDLSGRIEVLARAGSVDEATPLVDATGEAFERVRPILEAAREGRMP
jgi:CheY-like chemotaxis protein